MISEVHNPMTIQDLIQKLQEFHSRHGNVPVRALIEYTADERNKTLEGYVRENDLYYANGCVYIGVNPEGD